VVALRAAVALCAVITLCAAGALLADTAWAQGSDRVLDPHGSDSVLETPSAETQRAGAPEPASGETEHVPVPSPVGAGEEPPLSAPADGRAGPVAPSAPQGQGTVLGAVTVRGNVHTDERLILRTAGLEPGQALSRSRLRDAAKALHGLGLFRDVRMIESPQDGGTVAVTIEVVENPRIGSLSFKGNKKLSEEDLKEKLDLKASQLLTERKLFDARRALEAAYRDEGYSSALVQPVVSPPSGGKVDLVFEITEGKRVRIRRVDFEGNTAFEDDKLRGEVQLKKNSLFRTKRYTAERVREDVEKIEEWYLNHGFKDVKVTAKDPTFSEDRNDVELAYVIEEGPLYRFGPVTWTGNEAVSTAALDRATAVRPGDPFSQAKIEATTAAAYELYTEKGYLLELSIVPRMADAGDSVALAYQVREGEPSRVREITILGNTRTKERVIRRELSLIPGQLLRRSALMRSQRDVFALGFFEDVQVDYQPAGVGHDVDVSFLVKEKSSGTATAGAAYASDTGLTGFVEFGHNNVLGNGWAVAVHLERGSRRETFDVSFTEPWFLGTPTSVGVQVYNTIRDYDLYTEKQRGAGLNLGRPWFFKTPDFSRVYLGYELENVSYTDFAGLDAQSEEILTSSRGTASRLSFSFVRNSTNNPFYPTSGSRSNLRLELVGGLLGGSQDYYKPVLDHRVYFVPFFKPAIMLRNRLSWLGTYGSGRVPAGETFRLGGTRVDYLRGYPDYEIVPEENIRIDSNGREVRFPGGKVAYIFTAEYQFPIVNPLRGLFFLDAGNTWNRAMDLSLNDLHKGMGAGVRLEIPMLGQVGLDVAYGIDRSRWQTHFIIGPAF